MIREALEYLTRKETTGQIVQIQGRDYLINHQGVPVPAPRYAEPSVAAVGVVTLSAIVRYLTQNIDRLELERVQVRVLSPEEVDVEGWLRDYTRTRDVFATAVAELPELTGVQDLGAEQSIENFRINLMTCFAPTPERNALVESLRLVTRTSVVENEDDGLKQRVVVQSRADLKATVPLANPISLAPYRSFLECDQVASLFWLRMGGGAGQAITARLTAIDGGAWKIAARAGVGLKLQELLKEAKLDPKIVLW